MNETVLFQIKNIRWHNRKWLENIIIAIIIASLNLYLFVLFLGNENNSGTPTIYMAWISVALILMIVYLVIEAEKRFPPFNYEIRSDSFTYPYKLKIKSNHNNVIAYKDIKQIHFKNYGFSCDIFLIDGQRVLLSYWDGEDGYIFLVKLLIKLLNIQKPPDIDIIAQYFKASKNFSSLKITKLYNDIKHKNDDFQ